MSSRHSQIFVTKLPRDTTRDDLKDWFKKFGKIREVTLKRGYGFLEFYDRHDASDAIDKMNGERIDGNRLVVEKVSDKRERRSSRGPQSADKCFNCGERGHWANQCSRSRPRRRRGSSSRSRSRSSSDRDRRRSKRDRGDKRDKRDRRRSSSNSSSGSSSRSRSRSSSDSRSQRRTKRDRVRKKFLWANKIL
jgi:arginine/serine-rich splicing factor 7